MRLSFCGRLTNKGGRGVVGCQGSDRRGVMMNGCKSQFLVTKESAEIFKRNSVRFKRDGCYEGLVVRTETS